ncbi:MAG: hypothetical protein CSA18_02475 [Deltaproteobacteria bacterium]|nr:MAG: hypothetical protein CSB21_00990 [Deltaproteobacteria bacterium]PIE74993.1 MAG: hypothetical protein CSA18_02475 [Deltaproteobacteria bacterium]
MIINLLGTGTCIPSLERASSSVWVRSEKRELLLDAGTGCMRRLLESGGDPGNIDGIILTHFHPDHSSELVPILFYLKCGSFLKEKNFSVMGGAGLNKFYDKLYSAYGKWIKPAFKLHLIELEKNNFVFGDMIINVFCVNHRPESIALKLTDSKGKIFVFSGDMDVTEGFSDFCRGADLLVIESSFTDGRKIPGHLTPSEAADIAKLAGLEKIVLTHFYPEAGGTDFLENARKIFKGEIILGSDLMEIVL